MAIKLAKRRQHSDQSKVGRRRVRVESMDDLVEGQSRKGPRPRGWQLRFVEKITMAANDECWEWKGPFCTKTQYGYLSIANVAYLAHRISFLMSHGRIDPDLLVMHSCDNRRCVNPAHLSQGTDMDNIRDAKDKGRLQKGERNGMAKLSEKEVIAIRRAYELEGVSMQSLAVIYNVWVPCIWRIIHRLRWKHLL